MHFITCAFPGSTHISDPQVKLLQYMSFAECAIHFCQKMLPESEMVSRVYDMGVQYVLSAHPSSTNLVANVSHHFEDEVVYGDEV